jgi:hypothetical protein
MMLFKRKVNMEIVKDLQELDALESKNKLSKDEKNRLQELTNEYIADSMSRKRTLEFFHAIGYLDNL